MVTEVLHTDFTDKERFRHEVEGKLNYLVSARPTAVNMKIAADELITLANSLTKDNRVTLSEMKERYIYSPCSPG